MVKVYSVSDDLEYEIGCFEADVQIVFTDGTIIRRKQADHLR